MTTNADHVELEGLLRLRYAEIDELKLEIERLRAVLEDIAEGLYSANGAAATARAALENKP